MNVLGFFCKYNNNKKKKNKKDDLRFFALFAPATYKKIPSLEEGRENKP